MKYILSLFLGSTVLVACLQLDDVCHENTVACGLGCADIQNDVRHCGACGTTCASMQECIAGACQCIAGTTLCKGTCVALAYNARHCGSCGNSCPQPQVCRQGMCQQSCISTLCAKGQSCRAGVCAHEAVAACHATGHIRGFSSHAESPGPLVAFGMKPSALAHYRSLILGAENETTQLFQAMPDSSGNLKQVSHQPILNTGAKHILAAAPHLYVTNADTHALQVLKESDSTSDSGDGGVSFEAVNELHLGASTYPQGIARIEDTLWIPAHGEAHAGAMVVKVSIANPKQPVEVARIDLHAQQAPSAIAVHHNAVYVTLHNAPDEATAPGLLARVELATEKVTIINLATPPCPNPVWLAPVGEYLAISCSGSTAQQTAPAAASTISLVLLDAAEKQIAAWSGTCPMPGNASCVPMAPSRFAVVGQRILLGDRRAGRVAVLEVVDGGFQEIRGAGQAFTLCPKDTQTGTAIVSDVLAIP